MIDQSHPEHAAEQHELADITTTVALSIRRWQEAQRPSISDEGMLRQFPALGSTKTYKSLREGKTTGLVLENHLPRYRGVLANIEALATAAATEEIYDDLAPTVDVSFAVARLIPNRGKERLVLVEGPTGSGKTESLRIIAAKYRGTVAEIEAHEGWASLSCALGEILQSLGVKKQDTPRSKADKLEKIIAMLQESRTILVIDEGHHMTAECLNIVKTLINRTQCLIVIGTIGTLWTKLTARNWEEARQLIHNRLLERVVLRAPDSSDVEQFLRRRIPLLTATRSAFTRIASMAESSGRFAFLRRIAEAVKSNDGDVDAGAIIAAAEHIRTQVLAR